MREHGFRVVRLSIVLASYGYEVPMFGENMTREDAAKLAEEMRGQIVSRDWLGLQMGQSLPMYGQYKLVKIFLYDLPNESKAGLVLADCEAHDDNGFSEQVLNALRK